jgi:hypothetical protein
VRRQAERAAGQWALDHSAWDSRVDVRRCTQAPGEPKTQVNAALCAVLRSRRTGIYGEFDAAMLPLISRPYSSSTAILIAHADGRVRGGRAERA